nr:EOG090X0KWJ [Lepidurus arcticus]
MALLLRSLRASASFGLQNTCILEVISKRTFNNAAVQLAKPALAGLGGKKGKAGKLGPMLEKKKIPVETDPQKLVTFVCGSNVLKTGGDDIQLKADSEYPDWLWELRLGPPPALEELDPDTLAYWRRLRKISLRRNCQLMKLRKF